MRLLLAALLLAACAAPPQGTPVAAEEPNPRISTAAYAPEPRESLSEPLKAILACIRSYEGGYRSVSPSGRYMGAYQFDQRTWDGVARRHARAWIGVRPHQAPKAVQDRMAAWLYSERGLQPWPTPARNC